MCIWYRVESFGGFSGINGINPCSSMLIADCIDFIRNIMRYDSHSDAKGIYWIVACIEHNTLLYMIRLHN